MVKISFLFYPIFTKPFTLHPFHIPSNPPPTLYNHLSLSYILFSFIRLLNLQTLNTSITPSFSHILLHSSYSIVTLSSNPLPLIVSSLYFYLFTRFLRPLCLPSPSILPLPSFPMAYRSANPSIIHLFTTITPFYYTPSFRSYQLTPLFLFLYNINTSPSTLILHIFNTPSLKHIKH